MWQFQSSSGKLTNDGEYITTGYAGHGPGKNNPADQDIQDLGPPPTGIYTIAPARTDPHLGPIAMALIPDPTNIMHGRSAFFIHGDNPAHPAQSSHGCIVLDAQARAQIAASADRDLLVTS